VVIAYGMKHKQQEIFAGNTRLRAAVAATILALGLGAQPLLARGEAVVGKITQVTGKAQVNRGATSLDAVAAMPVQLRDELRTAAPGELTLQMLDNSVLTLNESSVLAIDESLISGGVRTTTNIGLLSGSVRSLVTSVARSAAPSFTLTTPNAIAGVRGTDFICRYNYGAGRAGFPNCFQFTDCATTSGTVIVSNNPPRPGTEVKIGPGQMTTVACLAAPLAATAGTLGVLTGTTGGRHGSVLGPAAIVGAGLVTAAVVGGTVAGVVAATSGGGGGTASPSR
jgi:hypothetical protein